MATVPTVPVEPAGSIAASADLNAWAAACTFKLGAGTGTNPMFFLMASATQGFTGVASAQAWSNTAAVFKDNDSGWASGNPTRYTIKTAGYWTFDWTINGGNSASNLLGFCQVVTTSSNVYNPSATVQFQYTNTNQVGNAAFANAGGLCPIYLFPNDYIQVMVQTGTSSTSGTSPFSHFTGEWVSA
jgi:hypothetical protein